MQEEEIFQTISRMSIIQSCKETEEKWKKYEKLTQKFLWKSCSTNLLHFLPSKYPKKIPQNVLYQKDTW